MKLLLDTNAYSALARGDDEILDRVRRATTLLLSVVVLGELRYGFRYGRGSERNEAALASFCRRPFVSIVPVTETTADRYSRIAVSLRRKGRPIPQNDLWIAAQTLEHGADLLSFDRHFEAVDGLVLQLAQ